MATRQTKKQNPKTSSGSGLYTLEVFLVGGPVTEEFVEKNPVVSRTIQIRGDQTLDKLHFAIFDAFDRDDEHMYEFQIGGKGPQDPDARCYVLPDARDAYDGRQVGDLTRTPIGTLGLKVEDAFGYWFDYGDDWWHQINVVSIEENVPPGKYPRVTQRVGESPPQYSDLEDEDEEWDEDEDEEGDDDEDDGGEWEDQDEEDDADEED
ncbi:MAG: plasmid pRiA4b ORF-3 family protein [Phycisphaerae bacterium]